MTHPETTRLLTELEATDAAMQTMMAHIDEVLDRETDAAFLKRAGLRAP